MRCFILGGSDADERLAPVLSLLEHSRLEVERIADLDSLEASPTFASADFGLVVAIDPGDGRMVEPAITIATHLGTRPGFVVLVADHLDATSYRRLVRSGAGDWLTWAGVVDELAATIRTLSQDEMGGERSAKVISLLPSKGGVGNTTVAIETAFRLANSRKHEGLRIGLVDLDLQGGTLAHALGVEPRLDILAVSEDLSRLDDKLLDVFTTHHSPRLDVFAGVGRRIEIRSVDPAAIFGTIDILARRYDALVLDIPQAWTGWNDTLLRGSDLVLATGGSSVPALRQLMGKLAHLDELALAPARVAAVVNECETTLLGRVKRRREIERVVADRQLFLLPRDDAAATNAADSGRPLAEAAPNSRLTKDLHILAEWIGATIGLARPPARRNRLFQKAAR